MSWSPWRSRQRPAGVIQIYLPFNPIVELIGRDNHQLYLILLCGFTLFYAILFRLVARASSKLQRQAKENEYLALHDSLTDLPNRALFMERCQPGAPGGQARAVVVRGDDHGPRSIQGDQRHARTSPR